MDSARAGFDAFDGVEIRLLGGGIVRAPAFTVAEAGRYLRMLNDLATAGDDASQDAVEELVVGFVQRFGLADIALHDLGLAVEDVDFGDMTAARAIDFSRLLYVACWDESMKKRSRAMIEWLDGAPTAFGLDADDTSPPDLFEIGRAFTEAFYLHIYGLAEGFCSRLATGTRATTWAVLQVPPQPTSAAGSPT